MYTKSLCHFADSIGSTIPESPGQSWIFRIVPGPRRMYSLSWKLAYNNHCNTCCATYYVLYTIAIHINGKQWNPDIYVTANTYSEWMQGRNSCYSGPISKLRCDSCMKFNDTGWSLGRGLVNWVWVWVWLWPLKLFCKVGAYAIPCMEFCQRLKCEF